MRRLSNFGRVILLLVIPVVPAILSALLHPMGGEAVVPALQQMESSDRVLFLDARSDDARRRKALPWALRLTEETWEQDLPRVLEAWTPESRLLVFCDGGTCNRSRHVAERLLRETGLARISVIDGGELEAIHIYEQTQRAVR